MTFYCIAFSRRDDRKAGFHPCAYRCMGGSMRIVKKEVGKGMQPPNSIGSTQIASHWMTRDQLDKLMSMISEEV